MSNGLKRTQIYLQESQVMLLRARARTSHANVSELIREAVDRYLAADGAAAPVEDPIDALIGGIDMEPASLSRRIDHHLYGPARRPRVTKRTRRKP